MYALADWNFHITHFRECIACSINDWCSAVINSFHLFDYFSILLLLVYASCKFQRLLCICLIFIFDVFTQYTTTSYRWLIYFGLARFDVHENEMCECLHWIAIRVLRACWLYFIECVTFYFLFNEQQYLQTVTTYRNEIIWYFFGKIYQKEISLMNSSLMFTFCIIIFVIHLIFHAFFTTHVT